MGHGYRTNKDARRALKLVLLLGQADSSAYGYGSTSYSSSNKNLRIMNFPLLLLSKRAPAYSILPLSARASASIASSTGSIGSESGYRETRSSVSQNYL